MTKLKKYLKEHGLRNSTFASQIGFDSSIVSRLASGKYKPASKVVRRIYEVTNGEVTPNDLYGLGNGVDQR